ncbi:MAG: signal peptide peptidase SppA [Phycisphaerales bacterium]|nr:signal peptide peptidase SppA [Phycisphaerales bacterium]
MRTLTLRRGPLGLTAIALAVSVLAASPALAGKSLMRLVFDKPLLESSPPDAALMALFTGEQPKTLYSVVKKIEAAQTDSKIDGIVMILENAGMPLAHVEELTRAFNKFRSSGKKVYCYTDYAGNGAFALASAADHITLAENGDLEIMGLNAQLWYYRGLLEKIGVQADMLHCGAYKSALEPYTRDEPSPEAAENVDWLLDGIYNRWIQIMADGRHVSADQMRDAVNHAPLRAEEAKNRKLIDAIGSYESFAEMLRDEYGSDVKLVKKYNEKNELEVDLQNPFAFFDLLTQLMTPKPESKKPAIGLIYIEGGIVTGRNEPSPFGGGASAASTTLRKAFDVARRDDAIKAVVVRINSPGGSALASDIIWKAIRRCAEKKPVIASMGSVAGSGGYYVAIPAETIFAEDCTITGSIGVVGGKFVWHELWTDKLGANVVEFNRGERSGLMSPNHAWTDSERDSMQKMMNSIYTQFRDRVMTSRGGKLKADLDQLAGGRVFTGQQALERGLVDRIGGLIDAIEFAANRAGETDYDVVTLPKQDEFAEIFAALSGQDREDEYDIGATGPATLFRASTPAFNNALSAYLGDAAGLVSPAIRQLAPDQYDVFMSGLQNMAILNSEKAGCFMPFYMSVR